MELDHLDQLAASAFDGYLVRKDLVRRYSRQYPVPTYVVEFLLGRYCATVDEQEIEEGMVLSIEPWSYHSLKMHGGTGKFGIQDQFVVTADGCEKIDGLRREIIQVSHPIL